ncbi:MAG: putative 2OG-Fe(II) oxygenase [Candidatus Competibacteraceae bacterium]
MFAEKFAVKLRKKRDEIVLDRGGSQFMHTHANSFISGILYITKPHPRPAHYSAKTPAAGSPSSRTMRCRVITAAIPGCRRMWNPGDMVLYPSYLLHGVPPNEGGQRITIAFNVIPHRLDSLGYKIRLPREERRGRQTGVLGRSR